MQAGLTYRVITSNPPRIVWQDSSIALSSTITLKRLGIASLVTLPYSIRTYTTLLVPVVLSPWTADNPGGSSTAPRQCAHSCSPPLPLSGFCHGARPVVESTGCVGPFYAPPSGSWSAPHARGVCAESYPRVC